MNPKCARCDKTVYPVEKMTCLDKAWHKGCFNCEVCHTKLTMKTYKGYDKKPYCNAHYPTTKFTAVADTPENKRCQEQQKRQSNLEYQANYRESLKKFTQVSDDPETRRVQRSQKQYSQASYAQQAPPPASSSGGGYYQHEEPAHEPAMSQPPPQMAPVSAPGGGGGSVERWVALYDYTAADDDETSFAEGDTAHGVEVIDDGWIMATIDRTGERGMVPSNYFERM